TLALGERLPTMFNVREFVEAGGLMSYGPSFLALYRRAGDFVDKILRGAKPADIPVEQPTNFELTLNLKTATALGLTVPQSILALADEVIEYLRVDVSGWVWHRARTVVRPRGWGLWIRSRSHGPP